MESKDILTLVISGISALIALCALAWSIISSIRTKASADEAKSNAKEAIGIAKEANDIGHLANLRLSAESEIALLTLINRARMRMNELAVKLADLQGGQKKLDADAERHVKSIEPIYNESVEVLLNSYELACGMYLDEKIDKERFKRQYVDEIKRLYDFPEPFKKRLEGTNSPYRAIRKVYLEWHDHEK